jgi:DNA-directed RNA polymerase subunit E'/Rpb7
VASVRPFGVFVRSRTLPRDGLVHASQIDDQIELSKDDPDDAKIQALTWAAQPGSEVRSPPKSVRHQ